MELRSPIICILGHIDTGKTKLLDYLRKKNTNEAGGITQQIGLIFISSLTVGSTEVESASVDLPGYLFLDTPGHKDFNNLRFRGISISDFAILVVDITHGLEDQTIESISLLKETKTPFLVALNKIDKIFNWNLQDNNSKFIFKQKIKEISLQLSEIGLNSKLYSENNNTRNYVSLVPISAKTGEGIENLFSTLSDLILTRLIKKIKINNDNFNCFILELKSIPSLGFTIDIILVDGKLKVGDKILLMGYNGLIRTTVKSILTNENKNIKEISGSAGVRILANNLENTIVGLNLYLDDSSSEKRCLEEYKKVDNLLNCNSVGIVIKSSSLGSLESLLILLKKNNIKYLECKVGPILKKDIIKLHINSKKNPDLIIVGFNVNVENGIEKLASSYGIKIITSDVIYNLIDKIIEYQQELKTKKKNENKHLAIFPCKLKILPNYIFNKKNPLIFGVKVEEGILKVGVPIVTDKNIDLGTVTSIVENEKSVASSSKGKEVCIKIESDTPKTYDRHFNYNDILYSKITRESIDILKLYFRDEMKKNDWELIIELKKILNIF